MWKSGTTTTMKTVGPRPSSTQATVSPARKAQYEKRSTMNDLTPDLIAQIASRLYNELPGSHSLPTTEIGAQQVISQEASPASVSPSAQVPSLQLPTLPRSAPPT